MSEFWSMATSITQVAINIFVALYLVALRNRIDAVERRVRGAGK